MDEAVRPCWFCRLLLVACCASRVALPNSVLLTQHPHVIEPDPSGKFAFACDLGCNSIVGYALDSEASVLTPHSDVKLHPGAGPRHLAFSPTAPFAYAVNEMDNTVTALGYDAAAGTLTVLGEPVLTLPPDTACAAGGGAAEITISHDGKYAYASVRMTAAFNASGTIAIASGA